jgi:hypothetical protein
VGSCECGDEPSGSGATELVVMDERVSVLSSAGSLLCEEPMQLPGSRSL